MTPTAIIQGAVGLAKAGLQCVGLPIDEAAADVVEARRRACLTCVHATRQMALAGHRCRGLTTWSRCELCTCNVRAKTRLASHSCPLGWWGVSKPD